MKRLRVILLVVIALGLLCPVIASSSPVIDGTSARKQVASESFSAFMREDFDALEKTAEELRKARYADGGWKIVSFYEWDLSRLQSDAAWSEIFRKLDLWRQKSPKSITAMVATGQTYVTYAWQARGNGYADSVTDEGLRLFTSRLGEALRALEYTPASKDDDCPQRYVLLLKIARGLGWDKEAQMNVFRKAIALEPGFYQFYNEMAISLLPKWGGENGEWMQFAEEASKLGPAQEASTIYTRIALTAWYNGIVLNEEPGFRWKTMKPGFQDMYKNFSNSPYIMNVYFKFACIFADRQAAADLLPKVEQYPVPQEWSNPKNYEACRKWASEANPK